MADADAGLLSGPRLDSADAIDQLVERDGDRIYRLALRITGVEKDAGEVIEDTLRAAIDTVDPFESQSALWLWIARTVARAAHERRKRRQPVDTAVVDEVIPRLSADGHFEPMVDWSSAIDEPDPHDELPRAFAAAIDELPADYRTALILRDVEGRSETEIADILTIEAPTVRSRVHGARLFVRERLSRHFERPKILYREQQEESPCRPA